MTENADSLKFPGADIADADTLMKCQVKTPFQAFDDAFMAVLKKIIEMAGIGGWFVMQEVVDLRNQIRWGILDETKGYFPSVPQTGGCAGHARCILLARETSSRNLLESNRCTRIWAVEAWFSQPERGCHFKPLRFPSKPVEPIHCAGMGFRMPII